MRHNLLLVTAFMLALSSCVVLIIEENACEDRGGTLVRTPLGGVKCVKEAK